MYLKVPDPRGVVHLRLKDGGGKRSPEKKGVNWRGNIADYPPLQPGSSGPWGKNGLRDDKQEPSNFRQGGRSAGKGRNHG